MSDITHILHLTGFRFVLGKSIWINVGFLFRFTLNGRRDNMGGLLFYFNQCAFRDTFLSFRDSGIEFYSYFDIIIRG